MQILLKSVSVVVDGTQTPVSQKYSRSVMKKTYRHLESRMIWFRSSGSVGFSRHYILLYESRDSLPAWCFCVTAVCC